jgi:hypothetical protein
MEAILKKYERILMDANYEVIQTPKLGWIILRTDYMHYSNPVIQLHHPEELEEYILNAE